MARSDKGQPRGPSRAIAQRYCQIVAETRHDPATLFTLDQTSQRVVAYLAHVAPAGRDNDMIRRAAHCSSRQVASTLIGQLVARGLLEAYGRAYQRLYRLAPTLFPEDQTHA